MFHGMKWAGFFDAVSWPHPHVFIHTAVDAAFDEKGLTGFRIRLVFDEMFSSLIRMDYAQNDN